MSWTTTSKRTDLPPPPTKAAQSALHAARLLLEALERIVRASPARQAGWALLALHLSRIPPPGVRAHHRRVAAAVLDDAAARAAGQVFAMANGDLVLLFQPADGGAALLAALARLFKADFADTAILRSVWPLGDSASLALAYVMARVSEGDRATPAPEPASSTGAIAAMDDIVQTGALSDLMHRQTAVLLRPGRALAVVPLFREVAISTSVLEARIAGSHATADPFLFNHLAARLDHRMLTELRNDVPGGGLLSMGLGAAALHINMTVSGILSQDFANFANACPPALAAGLRIGVEVQFVEAFADIKAFILARERLRLAKLHLVLDGVSADTLLLTDPGILRPSLVKLSWSAAMQTAGPELAEAITRLGADRIVMHRTENDAAVVWGMARGITRFQGRYVDAMLAAERMRACAQAKACTVRQCTERASATGRAGRTGCLNLPLLDLGAPVGPADRLARSAAPASAAHV